MMLSKDGFVKNLSGTSAKLDGKNYITWAQSFETFLAAHRKLKHLTQLPLMQRIVFMKIGMSKIQ